MIVELREELEVRCLNLAKSITSKRNTCKKDDITVKKSVEQRLLNKMCEWAVHAYLIRTLNIDHCMITQPNMDVFYTPKETQVNMYVVDSQAFHFNVVSQTSDSAKAYGHSFNKNTRTLGTLAGSSIFYCLQLGPRKFKIISLGKWDSLVLSKPKMAHHQESKVSVYLRDNLSLSVKQSLKNDGIIIK